MHRECYADPDYPINSYMIRVCHGSYSDGNGTRGGFLGVGGDTEIKASLSKATTPGSYGVTVQSKTKGPKPIFEDKFFVVKAPEIDSIDPPSGKVQGTITLKGKFFGSKKGKVYLNGKSCKVTSWTMNRGEEVDEIVFVVPKGMVPGPYPVKITNSVGEDTGEFTVVPYE